MMQPFADHLANCTGKKVRYYDVFSSAAAIEAMRSGRMHVGTMSTGDTAFAVNVAGAIPIGIRSDASGPQGYQLWVIVKKGSPYQKLSDLKGKKVAHTTPSSNSGNLAPRTLFPAEGLTPDKDYKVLFSGKHENSVSGVASGDYDAAPIAHDILVRMAERGVVKMDDFRIIWKSANFPPGGLSMAHDLAPALQAKIRECTLQLPLPAGNGEGLPGRRPLGPDRLQEGLGTGAQGGGSERAILQPRRIRQGKGARRSRRRQAEMSASLSVRSLVKEYVRGKRCSTASRSRSPARDSPPSSAPRAPASRR